MKSPTSTGYFSNSTGSYVTNHRFFVSPGGKEIALFSNVGRFHDPRICRLCYAGSPNKLEYLFTIHTLWHLEIWVELYSQHYSQESLFIPIFFIENIAIKTMLKILTMFIIFILFMLAQFIILIGVNSSYF
jgi:hypothetical protein